MTADQRSRTRLMALVIAVAGFICPPAVAAQDGAGNGIGVHGHWTIDVRNPDGSLASHTEFENALAVDTTGNGGGATLLAHLLGNRRSPGSWGVQVRGTNNDNSPCGPPAITPPNSSPCLLFEPNLVVTVPQTGQFPHPSGIIELSGSFTVTMDGAVVGRVGTEMLFCNSDTSPSACIAARTVFNPAAGAALLSLTSHTLATPIAVTKTQIVQVKVALSFS